MQINMTGFLNGRNARQFMDELWALLLSAQDSDSGIPAEFIQQKKDEILKREEENKIIEQIKLDKENADIERKKERERSTSKEMAKRSRSTSRTLEHALRRSVTPKKNDGNQDTPENNGKDEPSVVAATKEISATNKFATENFKRDRSVERTSDASGNVPVQARRSSRPRSRNRGGRSSRQRSPEKSRDRRRSPADRRERGSPDRRDRRKSRERSPERGGTQRDRRQSRSAERGVLRPREVKKSPARRSSRDRKRSASRSRRRSSVDKVRGDTKRRSRSAVPSSRRRSRSRSRSYNRINRGRSGSRKRSKSPAAVIVNKNKKEPRKSAERNGKDAGSISKIQAKLLNLAEGATSRKSKSPVKKGKEQPTKSGGGRSKSR